MNIKRLYPSQMIRTTIARLLEQDIKKLKDELLLFNSDADLWKTHAGIANTSGTLCMHLIGNLNHFIGAVLGGTGYVRQRDKEFSIRNISREEIIQELNKVEKMIAHTMNELKETDLEMDFAIDFGGKKSTVHVLMILMEHFNYHLGQINYHRRLVAA